MKPEIPNITPHSNLTPKTKFFEEVGDTCINVDGCIELARQADTPQARAIYRAYRKHLAQSSFPGTPEKVREEAFFAALAELGIRTTFKPISGDMK